MPKDPAFLFYYQDFLVGTDHMTDEQVGQYIKCMCHQANRGSIRPEHMKNICKTHDNHNVVSEKFKNDQDGGLFNQRLRFEIERRKNFCESRRMNKMSSTYVKHMETENETVNEAVVKAKKTDKIKIRKPTSYVKDNPPSLEEVKKYCQERKNKVDPQYFIDKNTTIGWLDKNEIPYRDWKSVIRIWESWSNSTTVAQVTTKRPVQIVVVEKVASGMDDRKIMQELAGLYTEHAINEALMQVRGAVR